MENDIAQIVFPAAITKVKLFEYLNGKYWKTLENRLNICSKSFVSIFVKHAWSLVLSEGFAQVYVQVPVLSLSIQRIQTCIVKFDQNPFKRFSFPFSEKQN